MPATPVGDDDLLTEFESWLRVVRGFSNHTVSAYLSDLKRLRSALSDKKLIAVSEEDLATHLLRLKANGLSSSTRMRARASIRRFYDFLVEHGALDISPAQELERPKKGSPLPKALTEKQIEAFLTAAAEGKGPLGMRDKAICEILYGTGMRQGELVDMTLRSIDFERDEVIIVGKGGYSRVLPIMGTFLDALTDYLDNARGRLECGRGQDQNAVWLSRNGTPIGRQTVLRIVSQVGERAGLVVTPHMLRHSIAVHLMDNGADLMSVKTLLGHKQVETTAIYARMSTRAIQDIYHDTHPRSKDH